MRLHPPIVHPGRAAALVAGLALAIGLAACGASSPGGGVVSLRDPSASPGTSAVPGASVDPEEAMLAFTKCMKEHGVDVQVATIVDGSAVGGVSVTGGESASGTEVQPATEPIDPETAQVADEACRHLLPAGGMADPNATMDPALADQMLKFAQCMRDNGVDYPDPVFDGGAMSVEIGGTGNGTIDPSSQAFQKAQETCGTDLPGGGPFVIGGSGSTSSSGTGPVVSP